MHSLDEWLIFTTTHVKISQLVTSLQTSRPQDVFALLVPNLLTTCNIHTEKRTSCYRPANKL